MCEHFSGARSRLVLFHVLGSTTLEHHCNPGGYFDEHSLANSNNVDEIHNDRVLDDRGCMHWTTNRIPLRANQHLIQYFLESRPIAFPDKLGTSLRIVERHRFEG